MHKKLNKSPLTYVLAQVRISPIEYLEKYIPQIQDSIRKEFPVFNKVETQTVTIAQSLPPQTSSAWQWHFKDKQSLTGVILNSNAITIHTSEYKGFNEFVKLLENILNKFNKTLDISLSTRIGLRYINVINSNVDQFVQKELLGFRLDNHEDKFLSKIETVSQQKNRYIKIRATHIRSNEIIKNLYNKLVPADLGTSAEQLSFKHHKEPRDEYLLLDIDGFCEQQSDFKNKNIKKEILKLHDNVYKAFSKAITDKAKKEWS